MGDHDATIPYILGHDPVEQERLDQQGAVLQPFTERLLRDAGIGPGMRVLEAGCGTGDVTQLIAELVGPQGRVIGVDRSAAVLQRAADKMAARGWTHVEFLAGDLATVTVAPPVDAIVGRLVLMYQPDPAATVRQLARWLRPGGVAAFLEVVLAPGRPVPGRPLTSETYRLVTEAFARSGADVAMGLGLPAMLANAGFADVRHRVDLVTIAGPDRAWLGTLAGAMRSLLPAIAEYGLADAAALDIDTLLDRLLVEATTTPAAVPGPMYVGGWASAE
jgi:SAM-dependent methyltransferase